MRHLNTVKDSLIKLCFVALFCFQITEGSTQNFSLSPLSNTTFCAGINNQRTFAVTITGISGVPADTVDFFGEDGAMVVNSVKINNNRIDIIVWFQEQYASVPKIRMKRRRDNLVYPQIEEFRNIKTLFGRSPFRPMFDPNIMVPSCSRNVNVTIPRIGFVRTGTTPSDNTQNEFEPVTNYEYILPPGVIPVSGLSPSPGLPNYYRGTNSFTVNMTSDFNDAVIQVRGLNDCPNTAPTNFQSLNLLRERPTINGPAGVTCGDVTAKTFNVVNVPQNANCFTSYKWLIANKGWLFNGSIPTTDVITTNPQIILTSANNAALPPQNVVVEIGTSNGQTFTATRTISFVTPQVQLFLDPPRPINCDEGNMRGQINRLPVGNYDMVWSATNGGLFNGNTLPQTNVANTGIFTKTSSLGHQVSYSMVASCGVFSATLPFAGCVAWDGFYVDYFWGPMARGERLLANIGTGSYTNIEWYGLMNGQYIPIHNTSGNTNLNAELWPCGSSVDVYVRAINDFTGEVTFLYYVGTYEGSCSSGYRMATSKKADIDITPNPANGSVQLSVNNTALNMAQKHTEKAVKTAALSNNFIAPNGKKPTSNLDNDKTLTHIKSIKILSEAGSVVRTQQWDGVNRRVVLSTATLPNGKYFVEVTDGVVKRQVLLLIQH